MSSESYCTVRVLVQNQFYSCCCCCCWRCFLLQHQDFTVIPTWALKVTVLYLSKITSNCCCCWRCFLLQHQDFTVHSNMWALKAILYCTSALVARFSRSLPHRLFFWTRQLTRAEHFSLPPSPAYVNGAGRRRSYDYLTMEKSLAPCYAFGARSHLFFDTRARAGKKASADKINKSGGKRRRNSWRPSMCIGAELISQ